MKLWVYVDNMLITNLWKFEPNPSQGFWVIVILPKRNKKDNNNNNNQIRDC